TGGYLGVVFLPSRVPMANRKQFPGGLHQSLGPANELYGPVRGESQGAPSAKPPPPACQGLGKLNTRGDVKAATPQDAKSGCIRSRSSLALRTEHRCPVHQTQLPVHGTRDRGRDKARPKRWH